MKTILCNVILSLLLFNTAFSAGPVFQVNVVDGEAAVVVQLANLEKTRTEVFLKTIDGRLWYSDFISGENGHSLKLDLEGMEEGAYLLGVSGKKVKAVKAFVFSAGSIHFFEQQDDGTSANGMSRNVSQPLGYKEKVVANISASSRGEFLNVQLSNLKSNPVQARITSLSGLNWHREHQETRNGFSKNYITEGMPEGDYYLYLKSGATEIIQFFSVREGQLALGDLLRAEVPAGSRS
ncbi:MAG: hypothetical protein KDD06_15900 [Phaeodactylibacter sp.]|nr:hypothetical protein [Phaeodactylibacter sp.]